MVIRSCTFVLLQCDDASFEAWVVVCVGAGSFSREWNTFKGGLGAYSPKKILKLDFHKYEIITTWRTTWSVKTWHTTNPQTAKPISLFWKGTIYFQEHFCIELYFESLWKDGAWRKLLLLPPPPLGGPWWKQKSKIISITSAISRSWNSVHSPFFGNFSFILSLTLVSWQFSSSILDLTLNPTHFVSCSQRE